MVIIELEKLVDAAFTSLDDLDEAAFERFEMMEPWQQVAYRYQAADCDSFAEVMSIVTGWPIVGLQSPSRGPLHRLNQAPDGRLIDSAGWVDLKALAKRYGVRKPELVASEYSLQDPENNLVSHSVQEWHEILSALRQMPWGPFNEPNFQAMLDKVPEVVDMDTIAESELEASTTKKATVKAPSP